MGHLQANQPHCVYECKVAQQRFYVGCTHDPVAREVTHRGDIHHPNGVGKRFASSSVAVFEVVSWYPDWETGLAAETKLSQEYRQKRHPLLNVLDGVTWPAPVRSYHSERMLEIIQNMTPDERETRYGKEASEIVSRSLFAFFRTDTGREALVKLSERTRTMWEDEEYREKQRLSQEARWAKEESHVAAREASAMRWAKEESHLVASAGQLLRFTRVEEREANKQRQKERFADPALRDKQSKNQRAFIDAEIAAGRRLPRRVDVVADLRALGWAGSVKQRVHELVELRNSLVQ